MKKHLLTGMLSRCVFNRLLQILDKKELIDWDVIALDGSNVRALKAAAGAKKNIPMNARIMVWVALAAALAGAKKNIPMNARTMGWVALAAALAPKSIW